MEGTQAPASTGKPAGNRRVARRRERGGAVVGVRARADVRAGDHHDTTTTARPARTSQKKFRTTCATMAHHSVPDLRERPSDFPQEREGLLERSRNDAVDLWPRNWTRGR